VVVEEEIHRSEITTRIINFSSLRVTVSDGLMQPISFLPLDILFYLAMDFLIL
jgi:hypothetical protein